MVTTFARSVSCPILYQDIVHRVQVSTDTFGVVSRNQALVRAHWERLSIMCTKNRPLLEIDEEFLVPNRLSESKRENRRSRARTGSARPAPCPYLYQDARRRVQVCTRIFCVVFRFVPTRPVSCPSLYQDICGRVQICTRMSGTSQFGRWINPKRENRRSRARTGSARRAPSSSSASSPGHSNRLCQPP